MSNLTDVETVKQLKNLDPLRNVPERIVPGHVRTQDLAEHLARYTWAAPRLSGRVLDLGCGVGYGAHHCLSINSDITEVVGVDRNWDAVRFARRTYSTRRLALVGADACRLPFMDGSFDAVACFEAIEHVRSPDVLLDEVKRVLRPQGLLLVSTPNKFLSSPLLRRPLNPHHRQEWYPTQFAALLRRYFRVDNLYGQKWFSRVRLAPVLLNCCKTLLKVELDRLGVLARFRRLYRTVRPYHCDCEAPVEHDVPNAVLEYSQIRKLVPEIVIAVAVRR